MLLREGHRLPASIHGFSMIARELAEVDAHKHMHSYVHAQFHTNKHVFCHTPSSGMMFFLLGFAVL